MGFWEAIIVIVAIGVVSDLAKSAIKRRGNSEEHKRLLASKDASIQSLTDEVARLTKENQSLSATLDEQQVLVDEAVSTFGSRLDRLRGEKRDETATTEDHVQASE